MSFETTSKNPRRFGMLRLGCIFPVGHLEPSVVISMLKLQPTKSIVHTERCGRSFRAFSE